MYKQYKTGTFVQLNIRNFTNMFFVVFYFNHILLRSKMKKYSLYTTFSFVQTYYAIIMKIF